MFDILNLFKKKPAEQPVLEEKKKAPVIEEIKLDNLAVHVMPERFRHQPVKANNAQTMGLVIIVGGVVFLIAASILMYLYLFKPKTTVVENVEPTTVATNQTETNQTNQSLENNLTEQAITTPTLPANDSLATTTASSSPEFGQQIPTSYQPGLDSDGDSLTDAEEIIFGTSATSTDSDGDTYLDGAEVANLYNPAGPGKLTSNKNISLYENKTFNYSVLYPAVWQRSVNGGDDSVMFKSADNQFIQIIVQPNSSGTTLDQWYLTQTGATSVSETNRVSGQGWQGIMNTDGLNLYLLDAKQKYIFTISYIPGENNVLDYAAIFKMMIATLTLKN